MFLRAQHQLDHAPENRGQDLDCGGDQDCEDLRPEDAGVIEKRRQRKVVDQRHAGAE